MAPRTELAPFSASLSLGEPSANVGQCRAKRLVHFERRGLPFEHEIGDRRRRHIADGVVLIGRVVDERSGAKALDCGIAGIGAVGDQDFGFALQDDEEFLLDVAMRRMRTMPRAQHRDMRLHAGEDRGRAFEERIGFPTLPAFEKTLAAAQVRFDRNGSSEKAAGRGAVALSVPFPATRMLLALSVL